MKFDAADFARAWRSVAIAAVKQEAFPALNKSVVIEEHADGVRLVATDTVLLLTAWVPRKGAETSDPPGVDEAPDRTAIAIDADGRAKNLLAHAQQLAARADQADEPRPDIALAVSKHRGVDAQLDGLETITVTIEVPGVERVTLPTFEGEYPSWRELVASFTAEEGKELAIGPHVADRLAKLVGIWPDVVIGWELGGADRPARVTVLGAEPSVWGVVMPARVHTPADPDDDGDQGELDEEQAA